MMTKRQYLSRSLSLDHGTDLIWQWCLTCSRPPGICGALRWSWSSSAPYWELEGCQGRMVINSMVLPVLSTETYWPWSGVRLLSALPWSVLSSATTRQPPSLPPSLPPHQILLEGEIQWKIQPPQDRLRELENIKTLSRVSVIIA